jgi:hypothetical protein
MNTYTILSNDGIPKVSKYNSYVSPLAYHALSGLLRNLFSWKGSVCFHSTVMKQTLLDKLIEC